MNRLVVNPNRPDAWEIQLKEGANKIGRGDATDFKIADGSVSGTHCQITVSGGSVSIHDLGSTNGTFINDAPTQEAVLQHGANVRLGQVEMIFYSEAAAAAPAPAPAPAAAPKPQIRISGFAPAPGAAPSPVAPSAAPSAPPAISAAPRLRVSGIAHAPEPSAPAAPDSPAAPPPVFDLSTAARFCKFHPKNMARWYCGKCKKSFCELCVNSHGPAKTCRACAAELAPLEAVAVVVSEKGFLSSLPGAFIYPFRGTGVLILIFATLLFSAMGMMAGIFSLLIKMAAIGYLFSYMQNIIHATAAEEEQMPEMPGMDDLFGAFFRLAGTVLMSFGLAIGLIVAKLFDVEIPISAIIITILLGCVYFPMAFLAVAIKDNVMASNPLVIVPSIFRVPGQYVITVILFAGIFGVKQIGDMISGAAGSVVFTATSASVMFTAFGIKMVWSFLSVYLLTVNMRILGLLYLTQKEKLAWD